MKPPASSPVVSLALLRCAGCGAPGVVTVAPGADGESALDLFVVERPEPARGWCLRCAARRGWFSGVEAAA